MANNTQQKIISLCKRRGFVFPGSEIYGGLANTYDLGPLGVLMLRNITNSWWDFFVTRRPEIYGMDTSILMSPKVWEASGHTRNFNDMLVDCKSCKNRTRADHLIENYLEQTPKEILNSNRATIFDSDTFNKSTEIDQIIENKKVEGLSEKQLNWLIVDEFKISCPICGEHSWTSPRNFNLLFETNIGIVPESQSLAYLRGEIAQGMFVNFKNVLDTMRPKLPFGIAQSGKAFRNEITLGDFIFRVLEFNLAEFEYFIDPRKNNWEDTFDYWKSEMKTWITSLGVPEEKLRWRLHTDEERSHYSTKTEDLDFEFTVGFKELFGLAYRTDFDLKNHMEKTGTDLRYTDPETGEKFIPHVVEPTFGINRVLYALLINGFSEEGDRVVLRLDKKIAPYRYAVFPLVKNKPELVEKAREVFGLLVGKGLSVAWDDRGNIGKRYLAQDEIGTPECITIDYQTLEDGTVTVRDRDTTEQKRVKIEDL